MQPVHRVVVVVQFLRQLDVVRGDAAAGLGDQALGDLAHLQDRVAHLRRDRGVGVTHPCDLRDVFRQVAHALQVAAHPQGGDGDAQVHGDGLLRGQQFEDGGLDLRVEPVDLLVLGDHTLGELEVGVQQCGGGPRDGRADQAGHLHQPVGESVEFIVEGVAHAAHATRAFVNELRPGDELSRKGAFVRSWPAKKAAYHRRRE